MTRCDRNGWKRLPYWPYWTEYHPFFLGLVRFTFTTRQRQRQKQKKTSTEGRYQALGRLKAPRTRDNVRAKPENHYVQGKGPRTRHEPSGKGVRIGFVGYQLGHLMHSYAVYFHHLPPKPQVWNEMCLVRPLPVRNRNQSHSLNHSIQLKIDKKTPVGRQISHQPFGRKKNPLEFWRLGAL